MHTLGQKEVYAENFIKNGPPQAKWIHHVATWPQGVHDVFGKYYYVDTFYLTSFFTMFSHNFWRVFLTSFKAVLTQ